MARKIEKTCPSYAVTFHGLRNRREARHVARTVHRSPRFGRRVLCATPGLGQFLRGAHDPGGIRLHAARPAAVPVRPHGPPDDRIAASENGGESPQAACRRRRGAAQCARLKGPSRSDPACRILDYTGFRIKSYNIVRSDWLQLDRKSTRLNSSHSSISYAVFCLKKKK